MKNTEDHVQRNLLRILAITATHWNLGYRKRTPLRTVSAQTDQPRAATFLQPLCRHY
jgi:hypothetical protein